MPVERACRFIYKEKKQMPELRKDPIIGRWVIIASERGKRPDDYASQTVEAVEPSTNPFAEGNEHMTPPEVFAFRDPRSKPNSPGWQVRVVPNKFPALRIEGELEKEGHGLYDKMNGVGAHEIIIETPNPTLPLEQQPLEGIARVLEAYKVRVTDLLHDSRLRYILIFKNHGRQAGATLPHPHSQLIATPVTPKRLKEKLTGAMQYYAYKDRSIFEDILKQEVREGTRLVYENAGFVSFCPFASRFPFEITIIPRRQSAYYSHIQPDELLLLADAMKVTLLKLGKALNQPQYNYIIHSAPARYAHPGYWTTIDQDFRWHIEILPRLTLIAGFEVGTGFYINPTAPEDAAKYLREIPV
jgi:UDPglucose--hexose-1-phosphate uridylyltransferase